MRPSLLPNLLNLYEEKREPAKTSVELSRTGSRWTAAALCDVDAELIKYTMLLIYAYPSKRYG